MSRKTNMLLAAGTGLTLVLIALPKRENSASIVEPSTQPETAPAPGVPTTAFAIEVLEVASEPQLEAQRARSEELTWERDPFARPAPPVAPVLPVQPALPTEPALEVIEQEPVPDVQRPRLTGVSRSVDERWAIVDGQVVREGDTLFSGHTVVRIERRAITLILEDEELNLKLGEQ